MNLFRRKKVGNRRGKRLDASQIFVLIINKDSKTVIKALKNNPELIQTARDEGGNALLHGASGEGLHDLVEYLLQNGADVDATNDANQTPLHIGAIEGHVEIVKSLLRKEAGTKIRDCMGLTPEQCAAMHNAGEIYHMLRSTSLGLIP